MKYKIPAAVQNAAKKALEWHKQGVKGTTSVGLRTARILAKGDKVDFALVKKISEYFPRHEVDKQAKGWDSDKITPGKKSWFAWGADAGWKWAKGIVERQEEKASSKSILQKLREAQTEAEFAMLKEELGALDLEGLRKVAAGYVGSRLGKASSKKQILEGIGQAFYSKLILDKHAKIAARQFQDRSSTEDKDRIREEIRTAKDIGLQMKLFLKGVLDGKTYKKISEELNRDMGHIAQLKRQAIKRGFDKRFGIEFQGGRSQRTADRYANSNAIIHVYRKTNGSGDSAKKITFEAIADRVAARTGKRPSLTMVENTISRWKSGKLKVPEEASIQDSLSRKLFEVAGLSGSEEELAWLSKKAKVLKKFNRVSGKDRRRRINEDRDNTWAIERELKGNRKKIKERHLQEGRKVMKPLWANVERISKAFGYYHPKCLNPRYDVVRDTFDMRVNIECPFLIEAAHEIIEDKMKGQNEYGITKAVKFAVNEIGTARGAYYLTYSILIEYMTDNGVKAKLKADNVIASENPNEVVSATVGELKEHIATIERKNLRLLLNRAVNKIKVPK